jgi:4-hydroxyphenylpyruvate dioxygenase-like putative hemolysin
VDPSESQEMRNQITIIEKEMPTFKQWLHRICPPNLLHVKLNQDRIFASKHLNPIKTIDHMTTDQEEEAVERVAEWAEEMEEIQDMDLKEQTTDVTSVMS